MGTEILGIIASIATVISGFGWLLDKNSKRFAEIQRRSDTSLTHFAGKVDNLEKTLTQVRLELPEKYVTKEELMGHIRGEEKWHESVDRRLDDIRGQISSLKDWRHR